MANNREIGVNLSFTADTQQAKTQLQQLQDMLTKITQKVSLEQPLGITKGLSDAVGKVAQLQAALQKATTSTGKLDLGQFKYELNSANLTAEQLATTLSQFGVEGQAAFAGLAQSVSMAEMPLKRTNKLLQDFAISMKNTAKWMLSSGLLHGFMGSVQKAIGYAEDLNKSLNNIRIVTGKSTNEMAEFAKEANEAAKALSTTTTAYTDASLIFYQQGLDGDAVKERTETVLKLSNVTGEAVKDVSSYMTAIWNNFADGSESLEHYADVITALGAATASSSAEIAEGLEKFAAIGQTVGLSYDYATAALATVVAKTRQSADTVGNAFKTIFARLQSLKLGETLEDDVDLTKYTKALAAVGVQVTDTSGQLKDLDTILNDLSDKWIVMGEAQKAALAQTVAGTRQYAQFIALMENWSDVQENVLIAQDSEGTLQKQANTYAEGWEGAKKRVQAAMQGIYQSILDDEFFVKFNHGFAGALEHIQKLIDSFGGLKGLLPGISTLLLKMFGNDMAKGIDNFIYNINLYSKAGQEKLIETRKSFNDQLMSLQDDGTLLGSAMIDVYTAQGRVQNQLIEKTKELQAQNKNISESEQAQLNVLLDINKAIGEQYLQDIKRIEALQTQTEELRDQATRQIQNTGLENDYEGIQNSLNKVIELQTAWKRVSDLKRQYSDYSDITSDKQAAEALQQVIDKLGEIIPQSENASTSIKNMYSALEELTSGTEDAAQVNEKFRDVLDTLDVVYNESQDELEIYLATLEELGARGKIPAETLKKLLVVTRETGTVMASAAVKGSSLSNNIKQLEQKIKSLQGQIPTTTQKIMAMAGAMSSFAMSINSVKSLMSTWAETGNEDFNFGDALVNSLMTIGFLIPSVINSYKQLNILFTTSNTVRSAEIALTKLKNIQDQQEIINNNIKIAQQEKQILLREKEAATALILEYRNSALIEEEEKEYLIEGQLSRSKELNNQLNTKDIEIKELQIQKTNLDSQAKEINTQEINKNTTSINANKVAISGWLIVAAAAVAAVALVAHGFKIAREEALKSAQAQIDANKKKQEEINKNKELVQSYRELIKSYQEGSLSKEELSKGISELCERYDLENEKILLQIDRYNGLTDAILKKRKAERDEEENNTRGNIDNLVRQAQIKNAKDNWFKTSDTSAFVGYEPTWIPGEDSPDYERVISGDLGTAEGILKYYNKIETAIKEQNEKRKNETDKEIIDAIDIGIENLEKEKEKYEKIVEQLKEEINLIGQLTAEEEFYNNIEIFENDDTTYQNFENTYDNIYNKVKNTLDELYGSGSITEREYNNALKDAKKYLNNLVNEYDHAGELLKQKNYIDAYIELFKNNGGSADIKKWLLKNIYSNKDGLEIQAFLNLDGTETENELNAKGSIAVANWKNQLRVATVEGLSKGFDSLSEKQIIDIDALKEMFPDKDDDFWNRFDASSAIEQVRQLSVLSNEAIEINHEAYEAEVAATKQNIENYEKEKKYIEDIIKIKKEQLEDYQTNPRNYYETNENDIIDRAHFVAFKEGTIDPLKQEVEGLENQLQELDKNYDVTIDIDINDVLLDDASIKVKELVSSADLLRSSIEMISEEFIVAKENAHSFANLYPELLENAQVLADGSIQLDQEVVNTIKAGNLDILKSDSAVTEKQLEDKITLLDAEIKYEQSKLEILEALYNGTLNETEGEKKLAEAENNYKEDLINAFGEDFVQSSNELLAVETDNTNTILEHLDAVDKRIEIISDHYSHMLDGNIVQAVTSSSVLGGSVKSFSTVNNTEKVTNPITDEEVRKQLYDQIESTKNSIKSKNILKGQYTALLSDLRGGINAYENAEFASGGKSSKASQNSYKEYIEKLPDRYHDINEAIKEVTYSMEKLEKVRDKLAGSALAASLKKENKLLAEQQKNYKKLGIELKTEQKELQGKDKLGQFGAKFNDDGSIANYVETFTKIEEIMLNATQKYNDTIKNSTSEEIKAQAETEYKEAQQLYDNAKDWLNRSDEIIEELHNAEEKYIDAQLKKIENNIKRFEAKFQIKFDIRNAKKAIQGFLREVNNDFTKIYKDADDWQANLNSYKKEAKLDSKNVSDDLKMAAKYKKIIENENYDYSGKNSLAANKAEAIQKYKEYTEKAMEDTKELYNLYKQAWDDYLSSIDEALDQWDDLLENFDDIADRLDHLQKMNELLYDKKSKVGQQNISDIYAAQAGNSLNKQATLNAEIKALQKQLNQAIAANGGDENAQDIKKIQDAIKEAEKDLTSEIENYLETIQNQFFHSVDLIMEELDEKITQGYGVDKLSERWKDAQDAAEGYYDDVQKIYQIEQLESKWTSALKDAKSAKNQQLIKNIMDAQLKNLEDKTQLSEYDVTLAEKQLEITKAQIALDEAQNNKNSMKLVRNEQGNWAYQYVADADDVANKEQKVLDLLYDKYDFVKKSMSETTEDLLRLEKEASERITELQKEAIIADKERRDEINRELEYLQDYYYGENGLIVRKSQETQAMKDDLNIAGMETLWGLYVKDEENYKAMTDTQKELINSVKESGLASYLDMTEKIATGDNSYYNQMQTKCEKVVKEAIGYWSTLASDIVASWGDNKGDNVRKSVVDAYNAIIIKVGEYDKAIKTSEEVSGKHWKDITTDILAARDAVENGTDGLNEKIDNLTAKTDAIKTFRKAVQKIKDRFDDARDATEKATGELETYLNMLKDPDTYTIHIKWDIKELDPNKHITTRKIEIPVEYKVTGSPSGIDGTTFNSTPTNNATKVYYKIMVGGSVLRDQKGGKMQGYTNRREAESAWEEYKKQLINSGTPGYAIPDYDIKSYSLDTGGYTGEWGNSGKLAMLHEKELVLNKEDTSNILNAVAAVREISGLGSSIANTISSGISSLVASMLGIKPATIASPQSTTNNATNTFHIHAEFPNANNVDEIREAILSLPNLASQYMGQNKI